MQKYTISTIPPNIFNNFLSKNNIFKLINDKHHSYTLLI